MDECDYDLNEWSQSVLSNETVSLNQFDAEKTADRIVTERVASSLTSSENIYQSLLNDFYNYDNSRTKWILTVLSSSWGIHRVQLHWQSKLKLLQSFYEIPDNPQLYPLLRGSIKTSKLLRPAFHCQVSLYLNPLGIAIYTQNEPAIRFLLSYNINRVTDPCFVQKWWHKGDDKYFTDFSAVGLINLVLRRNYFTCLPLMLAYDYDPTARIYHIDHIQSVSESKTKLYHDSMDLAFQMLYELPGLNIARFFEMISTRNNGVMHQKYCYNAAMFDFDRLIVNINNDSVDRYRLRSLFRLLIIQAISLNKERFLTKYVAVLATIQKQGYFRYVNKRVEQWKHIFTTNHTEICEETFQHITEIESQRISKDQIEEIQLSTSVNLAQLLDQDRWISISLLLHLLVFTNRRGKNNQEIQIATLAIKILQDCHSMTWFMEDNVSKVSSRLNYHCCINSCGIQTESEILVCRDLLTNSVKKQSQLRRQNMYQRLHKKKKTANENHLKKNPYLICTGRTIRNWNRPVRNIQVLPSNTNTAVSRSEVSMISLRHRIEEMQHEELQEVEDSKKSQREVKNLRKIERIINTGISHSNLGEFVWSDDNSPTSQRNRSSSTHMYKCDYGKQDVKVFPPPLIIRRRNIVNRHSTAGVFAMNNEFSSPTNSKIIENGDHI